MNVGSWAIRTCEVITTGTATKGRRRRKAEGRQRAPTVTSEPSSKDVPTAKGFTRGKTGRSWRESSRPARPTARGFTFPRRASATMDGSRTASSMAPHLTTVPSRRAHSPADALLAPRRETDIRHNQAKARSRSFCAAPVPAGLGAYARTCESLVPRVAQSKDDHVASQAFSHARRHLGHCAGDGRRIGTRRLSVEADH